jgi:hypothetical protein
MSDKRSTRGIDEVTGNMVADDDFCQEECTCEWCPNAAKPSGLLGVNGFRGIPDEEIVRVIC